MFEWEESVFLGIKSMCRRFLWEPERRRLEARGATLFDLRAELTSLARLVSGEPMSLFEHGEAALRSGLRVFLPGRMDLLETPEQNAEAMRLKVVLAALSCQGKYGAGEKSLREWLARSDLPGLNERIEAIEQAFAQCGQEKGFFSWAGDVIESHENLDTSVGIDLPEPDEEAGEEPVTELEGKSQWQVEALDELGSREEEALPIHTFEKTETLDEYSGLNRKVDGDDDLEEEKEALDKLDMKQVFRSLDRPKSIYRSDVMLQNGDWLSVKDGPETGIPYPEWDAMKRRYRDDWCWVQETRLNEENVAWEQEALERVANTTHRLRRQLRRWVSDRMRIRRQPTGSEFDLDAVVQRQVDLTLNRTPDERMFEERRKVLPDLSLLILMDGSFSTDSYVADRRALDLIRDSVLALGETVSDIAPELAIASFSSRTRRACRFQLVKSFDESWRATRARLGALAPDGYTRMGPALRHGVSLLCRRRARRKAILVLTDGRPCDYDRYEGRYGIKDVKRCVEEARQAGVSIFSIAIEDRAREHFPEMFPNGHFHVLSHPERLPEAMLAFGEKALAL